MGKMSSKQKTIAFLCASINFLVGYAQRDTILNITNPKLNNFIHRNDFGQNGYKVTELISGQDPRGYSMFLYIVFTFVTALGFVHFYFNQKKYTNLTCYIYGFGYVGVLILTAACQYPPLNFFFEISQEIKNSLSSSFFLLFLIALIIFDKKQHESKKSTP